jgi:two-component system, OmpR family, response regulator
MSAQPSKHLLLIEDDVDLATSLISRLSEHGYSVEHDSDGLRGLAIALGADFDAIIVDRMLPGINGLELVRALRPKKATPVIYLTTMSGIDDRVQGLEAGGDDYLLKPFAFPELLARIRALTRRSTPTSAKLSAGSIEMDLAARTVTREGRAIELVPQEFRLLEYLLRNADRAVTRKMLLEKVWDVYFDPGTNVVESHISRLRASLNAGFAIDAIQTVRGVGYRLLAVH